MGWDPQHFGVCCPPLPIDRLVPSMTPLPIDLTSRQFVAHETYGIEPQSTVAAIRRDTMTFRCALSFAY